MTDRAYARNTDPHTSHEAAANVDLTDSEWCVHMVLRHYGPCDDVALIAGYREAVERAGIKPQSDSGIRTRRAKLVEKGMAKAISTAKNANNNSVIIWAAV
jgi:hypothetical protein